MMRIVLSLFAGLLLTGCPQTKNPESPSNLPPSVENAPTQQEVNPSPSASVDSFEGTWTTKDEQGQVFDIVIFPNGQVITNWTKGADGVKGERGFWRREADRFIAIYQDGWSDTLTVSEDGFTHRGYSPKTALSSPPTNTAPAERLSDEKKAAYVGVWRLNQEPDGTYLYLALQSNGRAASTVNGGTEGKWEMTERGALCTWPDGWIDLISRGPNGWQRRSWIGSETDTPADISEATRVGEAAFTIQP